MHRPKIGITIGDINGIGPEVIIKCLDDKRILDFCQPVIYGSSKVVAYHKNIVKPQGFSFQVIRSGDEAKEKSISVVNCWDDSVNIRLGEVTEEGGRYAYIALDRAVDELKKGQIEALVTAPIHKSAMKMAGFNYPGHTEFITSQVKADSSLMLMVNDELRVGLVTNHLPLSEVSATMSAELIEKKARTLALTLKKDFGIEHPVIAVLAINPHAGDGGVIGSQDAELVRPVIEKLKNEQMKIMGPFPADGFFGSATYKKYDAVLAMYHDQGLIPFKLLSFGEGVNYTAGLPIVRTSVDHGTGFDIVGKNLASEHSMRKALYAAVDIVRHRHDFEGQQ